MVSNVGSITQTITRNAANQLGANLIKAATQSENVFAEAVAKAKTTITEIDALTQTAAKASETVFSSGAQAAATTAKVATSTAQVAASTAQTAVKRSFLGKIFRILSGEFADDMAIAFKNRKTIPFKEGFKSSFGMEKACETVATAAKEGAKKPGFLGKIGSAITKVCPFLKNSKINAIGKFVGKNISTLAVYAIAAYPVYKAFKKHGSSEGLKELLKFGITTACMLASEALIALLSVYTGGFAGLLRFAAPAAGASFGIWLGRKILGKSIPEKEQEIRIAKHNEQLQELLQNPKVVKMIQQKPELLQQLQQDPDMTNELCQRLKQGEEQSKQNTEQNQAANGQSLQAQTEQIKEQLARNGQVTPEEQKQRDNYASQFGNPHQSTSLGTFSNLVHNVDVPFAQLVLRQESLYNPFQSFLMSQQMNNDLAARGYIFG